MAIFRRVVLPAMATFLVVLARKMSRSASMVEHLVPSWEVPAAAQQMQQEASFGAAFFAGSLPSDRISCVSAGGATAPRAVVAGVSVAAPALAARVAARQNTGIPSPAYSQAMSPYPEWVPDSVQGVAAVGPVVAASEAFDPGLPLDNPVVAQAPQALLAQLVHLDRIANHSNRVAWLVLVPDPDSVPAALAVVVTVVVVVRRFPCCSNVLSLCYS